MLAQALARALRGDVRFDDAHRALYATDASNYRQVPIGVVFPRDADDIVAALAICREHAVAVLPRGAGTSLAGQCCNAAVVFDCSRYMNRILDIDPARRLARVEPGVILDVLRAETERHHLTFGPDPATHSRCTLGGMIGNNACGVHSIMAGKTVDNVEALEVLTYDGTRLRVGATDPDNLAALASSGGRVGEIYSGLRQLRDTYADRVRERFPAIPRRVSGYNLDELLPERGFHVARALVGSEGTCAMVLEATLRLVHSPPRRALLALGYRDVYQAADRVPDLLAAGGLIGLEGLDEHLVEDMRLKNMHPRALDQLPAGAGWLFAEFGGESGDEAEGRARAFMSAVEGRVGAPDARLFLSERAQREIWRVREAALGATAFTPGRPYTWEGWEDAAVRPEQLGAYLREWRALLNRYGYRGSFYGHFGHGCVHTRNDFDLRTRDGIAKYRTYVYDAAELVLRHGGSFSGEHGDGQSRGELLPLMFGDELMEAFRRFKRLWDPAGRMNPGKLVDANRLDDHLRLGAGYIAPRLDTHFRYPNDRNSFAEATLRCVGVGECRRLQGGTMCPSYMVTREERHSTRGRAHLLWEMTRGEVIRDGWKSEEVREALDLCLACKGCRSDCPVSVDVATFKAEFLAHYYQGRIRPRHAYAFGLSFKWAPYAARMSWLVNAVTQTPGLRAVAKAVAGMPQEREIPRIASESFQRWFARRTGAQIGRAAARESSRVMLWPDTFNNYFRPETSRAAVTVLEAAGFAVNVPRQRVCCGRPLYDYGMLDTARSVLRDAMKKLRHEPPDIPIVVLEPSCAATFRDELLNLFPGDSDAQALAGRVVLLSEFLARHAPGFRPRLEVPALVHGHCHHKAVMGLHDEQAVLDQMGLRARVLDSGCCGMAGAFGFEREHYAISMQVGERVLLPEVRKAGADTLVIADGFSCREQIRQGTGRDALHLAEVMARALNHRH